MSSHGRQQFERSGTLNTRNIIMQITFDVCVCVCVCLCVCVWFWGRHMKNWLTRFKCDVHDVSVGTGTIREQAPTAYTHTRLWQILG